MATTAQQQLFADSADVLRQSGTAADPAAAALLRAFMYDRPADSGPFALGSETAHRAALLRAAAAFSRIFQVPAQHAPGLVFFGADLDPDSFSPHAAGVESASASGVGLSAQTAFESCAGEGIEFLSGLEQPDEALHSAPLDASHTHANTFVTQPLLGHAKSVGLGPKDPIDWITARCLSGGADQPFPADLCLRRGHHQILPPPAPLSIGCAAGRTFQAAALHGLLELVERDAAALWWRGGARGRLIPVDHPASRTAVSLLAAIRRDAATRRCWLLDITSDLGVPSVAALSVEPDGGGFACGLAAGLTLPRAVERAILELCQMELAHDIVAAKRRERGDAGLNAADRGHLSRASAVNPVRCPLLHPVPDTGPQPLHAIQSGLDGLVAHLASLGHPTFAIDLTRPAFGIPVARVLCPTLEQEPSRLAGARLQRMIAVTGGAGQWTAGIPVT